MSVDGFLNRGFFVYQPKGGAHRSGLDALLIASAVEGGKKGQLADFGAGCGVAGFAAAHRCPDLRVDLVEKDPLMADLARQSCLLPQNAHLKERVQVIEADVTAKGRVRVNAGLNDNRYDVIIANPPYNSAHYQASCHESKAKAHMMGQGMLEAWVKTAAALAVPRGEVIFVLRPDSLGLLLAAMKQRFGDLKILPIHSKHDAVASRLVIKGVKGAKGDLRILPSFILHKLDGSFSDEAEAIWRGKSGLSF